MAGSKVFQCAGPSYQLNDRKAAVQSARNCYPQRLDGTDWMMASIPGEVQFASLGATIRGMRNCEGRWFVAAGNTLYEMNADGTSTSRGTLASSTGVVCMAHNTSQVAIVDGANLSVFNMDTNTLTRVTVAGWRGSYDVWELDGYMVFVAPDTQQFYISAIDDTTALDALDFSSADSAPDNIVAHVVSHRQLWLFGTHTAEMWTDSGGALFPFARYQSYTMDVGVVGRHAVTIAADTIFWVGQTRTGRGIVYMAQGNLPTRVSTIAVEQSLAVSTDLSSATMWAYQVEGHEFVAINAPGLSTTWVYDAAMQQWHERGEWSDGWQPLRSHSHIAYNGSVYAGDDAGNITRLDNAAYSLNSRTLVRERTWPHLVSQSMEPISYRSVELAMITGYGGTVTLEVSNDGGITFGPPLERSLGAIGRYMQRVRWMGLGTAFNRVFRIRTSGATPFALHDAAVEA
jgi:hypothetical protein